MARKTRSEFPGAIADILDREDRRERLYGDDDDRSSFLGTPMQAGGRTGWRLSALDARGSSHEASEPRHALPESAQKRCADEKIDETAQRSTTSQK
jgi:hypothetical protein